MANWHRGGVVLAAAMVAAVLLFSGCAGGQTTQQTVTTENLLTTAGFKRLEVNMETDKRQALLNSLPRGKISTYTRNGEVYHAYPDENGSALYIGDQAAYQKYLSLARGRNLCERVSGPNGVAFWRCMEEYREQGQAR